MERNFGSLYGYDSNQGKIIMIQLGSISIFIQKPAFIVIDFMPGLYLFKEHYDHHHHPLKFK